MVTRRSWLRAAAWTSAAGSLAAAPTKPAVLGGSPLLPSRGAPHWPIVGENDRLGLLETLRSGSWYRRRGHTVAAFESEWAKRLGAKHALATSSGTTALWAALNALDIGPGDEVLVPPYTFIATVNVVLLQHALPIFVDVDRETFQIDASLIDRAITPHTRAVMPVHLGGGSADMDVVLETGRTRNIAVVEDACQSHLAEWRGRKVGTLGDAGCFSFQASKNLNCGEGGALVTNNDALIERASAFHNNGGAMHGESQGGARDRWGCNVRMTEFQAALLHSQSERLQAQAERREANSAALTSRLNDIPGIRPARSHEGCTRNAYHLYMFRYEADAFSGLPRDAFVKALKAEGLPASGGYRPLNRDRFLEEAVASRAFQTIYSDKRIAEWRERNHCPQNDLLCDEAVWLPQTHLLGDREAMERTAQAVDRVRRHAEAIRKTLEG